MSSDLVSVQHLIEEGNANGKTPSYAKTIEKNWNIAYTYVLLLIQYESKQQLQKQMGNLGLATPETRAEAKPEKRRADHSEERKTAEDSEGSRDFPTSMGDHEFANSCQ